MDTSEILSHSASGKAREGALTKTIEQQTAKLPSILFLTLAGASVALSVGLAVTKRKDAANFVGLWVPSFLLLGLYNKIVKVEGSEQKSALDLH